MKHHSNEVHALGDLLAKNKDMGYLAAVTAFKFFLDMSKKQVIDEDILTAILQDAGVGAK